MATLAVWRYDTVEGAATTAEAVRRLARKGVLPLRDTALVEWEPGAGKPRTRQLGTSTTAAGALGGGFWALLFGLVFSLPLLGAAIGATTGTLAGALADVGIDDSFINRVRDAVTPGTSALFVLASGDTLDRLREAVPTARQGTLIFASLTDDQEAAVRAVFTE